MTQKTDDRTQQLLREARRQLAAARRALGTRSTRALRRQLFESPSFRAWAEEQLAAAEQAKDRTRRLLRTK